VQDRLGTDHLTHFKWIFELLAPNVAIELQIRAVDVISLIATSQVSFYMCVCACLVLSLSLCVDISYDPNNRTFCVCVCVCVFQVCAERVAQYQYVKWVIPLIHVRTTSNYFWCYIIIIIIIIIMICDITNMFPIANVVCTDVNKKKLKASNLIHDFVPFVIICF